MRSHKHGAALTVAALALSLTVTTVVVETAQSRTSPGASPLAQPASLSSSDLALEARRAPLGGRTVATPTATPSAAAAASVAAAASPSASASVSPTASRSASRSPAPAVREATTSSETGSQTSALVDGTYTSTGSGPSSSTARPVRAPEGSVANGTAQTASTLLIYGLRYGDDTRIAEPQRYGTIVLQEYMKGSLGSLRSRAPGAQFLAYKNVGAVNTDTGCASPQTPSSGVSYCEAGKHADWFLYNSAGKRLTYPDHANLMPMDPTNASYRSGLASAMSSSLSASGFDGAHLDDVNLSPGHDLAGTLYHYVNGSLVPLSDAAYGQGMVGLIAQVGPYLKNRGQTVTANVAMDPWNAGQVDQTLAMGRNLSGINKEHFLRWHTAGSAPFGGSTWDSYLSFFTRLQAQGTAMLSETWGAKADKSVQEYTRASWLMAWDGSSRSSYTFETDEAGDGWLPSWGLEIGRPSAARADVNGLAVRAYTGGKVVANPTGQTRSLTLDGSYRRVDGSLVSGTVSVPPLTGLVLRRA